MVDVRYEMWDNRVSVGMLNLTSHISHLLLEISNLIFMVSSNPFRVILRYVGCLFLSSFYPSTMAANID